MNISRNNYEVYVIDYFDGKLDPVQIAELMYFLSQNPDLENEFNAYEKVHLPDTRLKFTDKDHLKKNFSDFQIITDNNFEEFCIAQIEGDLDEKSQVKFFQYLDKNPLKNRELELYRKTKLKPDESLIFPGLNQLKKHQLIFYRISKKIYYAGTAAAIFLIVLLTFIFRRIPETDLITSTIPVSKETIQTDAGVNKKTEEENISLNKTNAFMNSVKKTMQVSKMISFNNDVNQSASGNEIVESNHTIKPIEIQKINNIYNPNDIAILKKDHPIQYQAEQPLQTDKSLAEFIREKLFAQKITRSGENLNVWTFAQASLKGINYLTESDVQMSRKLNMNGEMSEFSIESESFSFSTQLKK